MQSPTSARDYPPCRVSLNLRIAPAASAALGSKSLRNLTGFVVFMPIVNMQCPNIIIDGRGNLK